MCHRRAFVNTVMNLTRSMKYGELLISRAMVGFQKGFFCVNSDTNCSGKTKVWLMLQHVWICN